MTTVPPSDEQRAGITTLFKKSLAPKDPRQHSPCPTCFLDCISDEATLILTFTCPRGHTHTTTRGAAIKHTTWVNRYTTHVERNV